MRHDPNMIVTFMICHRYATLSSKEKRMKKIIALMSAFFLLSGCAATQTALSGKDLNVENRMSATIFLDIEKQKERTVFVDIRNTSAKDIDIAPFIISNLEGKNYKVVNDAGSAFYLLQANILFVGKADKTALDQSIEAGFGGVLAGAAAGAAVSKSKDGNVMTGAVVGGFIGGAAELISGSLVKDVTYSVITDIQISEKTDGKIDQETISENQSGSDSATVQSSSEKVGRKKYQARLATTASQVNLDFEEARPLIEDGLIRAISGLF